MDKNKNKYAFYRNGTVNRVNLTPENPGISEMNVTVIEKFEIDRLLRK